MFLGTYTPKLDEKGRLFLPAKFRDELAEGLVVTTGAGALPLRLPARRLRRRSPAASRRRRSPSRARVTTPASSAPAPTRTRPDKQGRITIPPMLREYAALDRDVIVIGVDEPDRDLGPGPLARPTTSRARRRSPTSTRRSSPA